MMVVERKEGFCHVGNTLIHQYKPYLSNYLDDWIIAMLDGEEGLALHREIIHAFLNLL
jgi:hypothetical protein